MSTTERLEDIQIRQVSVVHCSPRVKGGIRNSSQGRKVRKEVFLIKMKRLITE